MHWYNLITENRELIKLLFTMIIVLICFIIVLRTHKIFKLSEHEGVRYFRNSFLFYGLAFLMRYITWTALAFFGFNLAYAFAGAVLFEFFIIMASFFMLYSLLHNKLSKGSVSSLFNARVTILYSLALLIGLLDMLWSMYYFMFLAQIITFSFAGGIAFAKYTDSEEKQGFLKSYLIIILLNLVYWVLEFVVASLLDWNIFGLWGAYVLNIFIFLMFLYTILKTTRR